MKNKRGEKVRILTWRGVLADSSRLSRAVVAISLAVISTALAFTQLGFAGIGSGDEFVAYVVMSLLPIALCALLLGGVVGAVIGLYAGLVLYLHATYMPLDYYEFAFVTPTTSIAMFGTAGFILGVLFAFVLRNDPTPVKSVIYITIVCFVVSGCYSSGFMLAVMTSLLESIATSDAINLPDDQLLELLQSQLAAMILRMGNVRVQFWADGAMMSAVCIVGYFVARKATTMKGPLGLRTLFNTCALVVAVLVFLVTAPIRFVSITQSAQAIAEADMSSEINYLEEQLKASDARSDALTELLDSVGFDWQKGSDKDIDNIIETISIDDLLYGYTVEADGTVVVSLDDAVLLSDDPRFVPGNALSDSMNLDVLDSIEQSVLTGQMQRVIDDEFTPEITDIDAFADHVISSHIDYVLAKRTGDFVIFIMKPASKVFANRSDEMARTTMMSFVLLLVVFVLTTRLLSTMIVRRIDEINVVLGRITDGNLDERVNVGDSREFESLSAGINTTVVALKGWIAEAETRMDSELATAKTIQESALPRIFPPYPDIGRFDIYASMKAAREVGGDFYDFFLIGDGSRADSGKLGIVVADVSGKGVPAALFMMNAKTLIRSYMGSGMELGEAIENVNRIICDGNDAGMFVTAWVGVLDYGTGHIDFVNAGHNPPLIWQEGTWRWIKEKSGLPLGLFDGLPYRAHSFDCQIGDELLVYTDGVTEAMSVDGELFGEERLEEVVRRNYTAHPRELIEVVRHDVAHHARGAEQSDDITILALEFGVPPEVTATLVVPADVDELPRVNEFIHTELDRRLCPARTQSQLDIAVEELFVNVAHYAYPNATPDQPGMVRVSYTYCADPVMVTVDIADEGVPYNPLAKPDAVTPDNIADVPIGGLGILMAKRSVDEMHYERVDGSNVVTIVKKW